MTQNEFDFVKNAISNYANNICNEILSNAVNIEQIRVAQAKAQEEAKAKATETKEKTKKESK